MTFYNTNELNKLILNDAKAFSEKSEELYEKQILETAESIAFHHDEKPIILASGPSGAGKTTTAMRIASVLGQLGLKTHVISLDNYFLPLNIDGKPRVNLSKIDLESPERLDFELLKNHIEAFKNCEEVTLPIFAFAEQKRLDGSILRRKENELIILEGIHALNPAVTESVSDYTTSFYVCVNTQVNFGGGALRGEKIRLMRRLIRDHLFRGRTVHDILKSFLSVERGEKLYIHPFKNNAEYEVNTFMPYEIFVYNSLLLSELEQLSPDGESFDYVRDIIAFFHEAEQLPPEIAPSHSLIREFIGGSAFVY